MSDDATLDEPTRDGPHLGADEPADEPTGPAARSRRAEPLPPDERRRRIAEAVASLLIERGAAVTTKELAECAGVAEGTLFSVFPDKRALIEGAIAVRVDPAPLEGAIAGIDRGLDLVGQTAAAAHLISAKTDEVVALLVVLHTLGRHDAARDSSAKASLINWSESVLQVVTGLLSEHREELRTTPRRAAAALLGLVVAARRPYAGSSVILSVDEIVDVVLFGATVREGTGGAACH